MNKLIICGRLTRDPEVRYINDNKIGRYTLAVDSSTRKRGSPMLTSSTAPCSARVLSLPRTI